MSHKTRRLSAAQIGQIVAHGPVRLCVVVDSARLVFGGGIVGVGFPGHHSRCGGGGGVWLAGGFVGRRDSGAAGGAESRAGGGATAGIVRWLRPEFQNPRGERQREIEGVESPESRVESKKK